MTFKNWSYLETIHCGFIFTVYWFLHVLFVFATDISSWTAQIQYIVKLNVFMKNKFN